VGDRRRRRLRRGGRYPDLSPKTVTAVLVVAAVISSTGAIWTVADAGHSGAKATWEDVETSGGD
jgi:hypothetical protein